MSKDQVMGILRWVLSFAGGVAVGKGWLTQAQVIDLTNLLLQVAGPLAALAAAAWALKANSKTSILQSASQMPEVKSMTITDPALASAAKTAEPATEVKGS